LGSETLVIRMHLEDTTQSRILRSLRFPTAVPDYHCPALSTELIIRANARKLYAEICWTPFHWFIRAALMSPDAVMVSRCGATLTMSDDVVPEMLEERRVTVPGGRAFKAALISLGKQYRDLCRLF
jgi:hypothetical protein